MYFKPSIALLFLWCLFFVNAQDLLEDPINREEFIAHDLLEDDVKKEETTGEHSAPCPGKSAGKGEGIGQNCGCIGFQKGDKFLCNEKVEKVVDETVGKIENEHVQEDATKYETTTGAVNQRTISYYERPEYKRNVHAAEGGCITDENGAMICGVKGGAIGKEGVIGGKGGCIRFREGGKLFCGGKVSGIGKNEAIDSYERDWFRRHGLL